MPCPEARPSWRGVFDLQSRVVAPFNEITLSSKAFAGGAGQKPQPAAFLRVGFRQQIWDISRPYSDIFPKNYESGVQEVRETRRREAVSGQRHNATQTVVIYVETRSAAEAAAFKLLSGFRFNRLSGDGRANLGLGHKTDRSAFLLCGHAQQLVWRAVAWALCGWAFSGCIGLLLYTTTLRLGH